MSSSHGWKAAPSSALVAWAALAAGSPSDEPPTWSSEIGALVHAHCSVCHRPEGSAPFPLLTHADASRRARQIAEVTQTRLMPPWKPEPSERRFHGDRRLTDDELDAFARWAEAGAPLGDPDAAPPTPRFEDVWALGEPDLVLRAGEAYRVPAEGLDVWRCFVLSPELERERWVRAVEFRPSNPKVVHHIMLYFDPTGAAREHDAADPDVGYAGMFSEGFALAGELTGWTPGSTARALPDGTAWRLGPGAAVVLDTHFQPTGKTETEQTELALYFTDEPPRVPLALVRLGAAGINIPPGRADYVVTDSLVLPADVTVTGILPHAHRVCTTAEAWAVDPHGTRVPLIRIGDWDFDWQDFYQYAEPVPLSAGTRVEMRFVYDNSAANPRNPHAPPRRVFNGIRSRDEMAALWLQVTAASEEELARIAAAVETHEAEWVDDGRELEQLWLWMTEQFDADGDTWLDEEEERRVELWIGELFADEQALADLFDEDGDGVVSETERARAERIARLWRGERGSD